MPSSPLSRRHVLTAVGGQCAMALSGCSTWVASEDSSTPTLSLQLEPLDGPLRARYVYDLTETRPEWDEAAFRAALNDTPYTSQYRHPFPRSIDDPAYARHDGTYYRLDAIVIDEVEATRPVLRLYRVGRPDELDAVPEAISHADLPPIDRHGVEVAWMAARARGNAGGVPWGLVQRGGYVYRDPDAAEASRLSGSDAPAHVEFRDVIWRVETARERFHEPVYRPDVDPVADSELDMETILRARLVDARLDPGDLSADERELVRAAMGEGLTASPPFSSALESLLRKMDHRAYLDGDISKDANVDRDGRRILLYGDSYYRYRLTLEESGGQVR